MKRRFLEFFLVLWVVILCSGCSGENIRSKAESSAEPEAFGITETTPRMAQTVEDPSAAEAEPEQSEAGSITEQQALAAILSSRDGLDYDPEDPVCFWRTVGYLVGLCSNIERVRDVITIQADGSVYVSQENINIFIHAVFGNYTGEIPAVTEEDPLITLAEDGGYIVQVLSAGAELQELQLQGENGVCTAEAELLLQDGSGDRYQISLSDYTGPEQGRGIFAYSISGVTPAE